MSEINIRPLLRKDRVTLANMIKKLAAQLGSEQLLNIISSSVGTSSNKAGGNTEAAYVSIALQVLRLLLETLENDVAAWFADLTGKTLEEFDLLPIDVEIQIVNKIVEAEEMTSFFTQALLLFKKMQGLKSLLPAGKKA